MKRYLALAFLVVLAAFPLPGGSSETSDAEALVERYLEACNTREPLALAALYTEDGLVLPPNGGSVRGREAIGKYWTRSGRHGLSFNITRKEICGDAGFFVGEYKALEQSFGEMKPANSPVARASLRPRPERGNFVLCLRRGEYGWKIAADMWTQIEQVGLVPAGDPKAP